MMNSNNIKYHIVYKTTNLVNGKFYIGKHSTYNLDDGYLGSSQHLKASIKKYGKENFQREIICFCDSEQDAYIKEAELVTIEVVNDTMTYNKMPGGEGKQKMYTDHELKERRREQDRKWYQANRERKRDYYEANREQLLDYQHEYYEANRVRQQENYRKWIENHRDEYNAKRRAKYAANKNKNL